MTLPLLLAALATLLARLVFCGVRRVDRRMTWRGM